MSYSESSWRNRAAPIIKRVLAEHAGEDESAIRAALREAYPFGQRKNHPYQIWLSEVQIQMGIRPKLGSVIRRRGRPTPSNPDPRQEGLFADR